MKKFTSVNDIDDPEKLVWEAIQTKHNPLEKSFLGKGKTMGLIFLNPSLRTRLSTQKAAINLGMHVMVMNLDKEGWALELEDGSVMNGSSVEHIKDAAKIMGLYCDIIGIRCFPKLISQEEDNAEKILNAFVKYCSCPIISLESATLHPLQSLADMITIFENKTTHKPKVVLTWAPHVKSLPQAVSNSFAEWAVAMKYNLVITHPKGYELNEKYTNGATIEYDQQKALQGADFVYVKNWSSYNEYGKILHDGNGWNLTNEKLSLTKNAKVMHCLPVRRNLELSDEILDGEKSLIYQQAENRVYAAQVVLEKMLKIETSVKTKSNSFTKSIMV